MNNALYLCWLGIFWLTPPAVLGWKFFSAKPISWWFIFLAICFVCWLSINAAVYFAHAHLAELQSRSPNDLVLRDRSTSDGAANVFALLFGWLYGLVCSLPWLAGYGILHRSLQSKKVMEGK